jgi:hypothetical protein
LILNFNSEQTTRFLFACCIIQIAGCIYCWFIFTQRLLEPIGNIPPAEAEQRYYAVLEQAAMAA